MDNLRRLLMMLVAAFSGVSVHGATIILQPGPDDGKDISLYKRTDIELSSSKSLYAINTGPPGPGLDDFTSLIEFDLSSVAEGTVTAATLWLYENNVPTFSFQHVSTAFPNMVQVEPAAEPWDEATVFYSTLPEPAAGYAVVETVDAVNQWFAWDVTAAVADWIDGDLANNGFLITSTVEVRNNGLVVGAAFDASELPNAPYLEIELMNVQSGDYNRDRFVDGSDFLAWQREFGSLTTPGAGADGNGDGEVNAADLTVWGDNFGAGWSPVTNSPANSLAIPEPTSASLAAAAYGALAMAVMCRRLVKLLVVAIAFSTLLAANRSSAFTVPFIEEFSNNGANWRQNDSSLDANFVSTGGVGGVGDGYVSVERTFTANPDFAQTVFRGHDDFDASGDSFVGDWQAAGVGRFSFYIRHNAATDLSFGTRFATASNSPGANAVSSLDTFASPNEWTQIVIPVTPQTIAPEGPPSFYDTVFQNIGNLQISARPGANLNVPITFDLDRVAIAVPEPSAALLFAMGGFALLGLAVRQRQVAKVAVVLIVCVCSTSATAEGGDVRATLFTPLPEPIASFGAATLDGYLYVYGGHIGERHDHSREHVVGSFRRQALSGGEWELLPKGPALQSPALVAHGGKLYRIGGLSARNAENEPPDLHSVASVDCFDPATRTWSQFVPMSSARSSHDAVVVGDSIYVVGGWRHHGDEGEGDWHDSLLQLDLSARQPMWKTVAQTPFKRRALSIAALGRDLYVIGGMTRDADFSREVDVYHIEAGSWSKGPELPESEYNGFGSSAFTIDGRLYASSMSDQLLVLSIDGNQWHQAAILDVQRFFHRLIPGSRGSALLVAGANDENGHLASISCINLD